MIPLFRFGACLCSSAVVFGVVGRGDCQLVSGQLVARPDSICIKWCLARPVHHQKRFFPGFWVRLGGEGCFGYGLESGSKRMAREPCGAWGSATGRVNTPTHAVCGWLSSDLPGAAIWAWCPVSILVIVGFEVI